MRVALTTSVAELVHRRLYDAAGWPVGWIEDALPGGLEHQGQRTRRVEGISFHGHRFPVPGRHSYREGEGEFGAPRPGRVHQGKDVWAPCGARLLAARGGRLARAGYDPRLYGHFAVIDGRGTSADLFYVHLSGPPTAREGERVRTGERIGRIGRSGNAQSVGCMLHLEIWPRGFRRGNPVDPEPQLRAWDSWS
jgi:murein DD-endopeptidase MepM/ murein hydrolase activator NlpD